MDWIWLILAAGAGCVLGFLAGMAKRQKPAAFPPVCQRRGEKDREQERLQRILQNLECYDGTGAGQREVDC